MYNLSLYFDCNFVIYMVIQFAFVLIYISLYQNNRIKKKCEYICRLSVILYVSSIL